MATWNLSGSKVQTLRAQGLSVQSSARDGETSSAQQTSSPWGPCHPCPWAGAHFPPGGRCTHTHPHPAVSTENSPSSVPSHLQVMKAGLFTNFDQFSPASPRASGLGMNQQPHLLALPTDWSPVLERPGKRCCLDSDGREATTTQREAPRVEAAVKKQSFSPLCLDSMKQYSVAQDSEPT